HHACDTLTGSLSSNSIPRIIRPPPSPTLFPYTTLFRSVGARNTWFVLHVALSALGLALMALAFIAAALYLLQFRELKASAIKARDRKSTRLNSSHVATSHAGFCLKTKTRIAGPSCHAAP